MRASELADGARKAALANCLLERLAPAIRAVFAKDSSGLAAFERRCRQRFPDLLALLASLYGEHFDLGWHIDQLLLTAARAAAARPPRLRARDERAESRRDWFLDHRQLGGVAYVDRFGGTLSGVEGKLDTLAELGLSYLHLMPLFARPEGDSDGGYAVSDYARVHPPLGDMADLARLADAMHARDMSLCIDFILNHTADDHAWAQAAKRGEGAYRDFYFMFEDRTLPDAFAEKLRAIFPERGGDAFVWRDDVEHPSGGMHVWATFYPFQWDLNYANPAVLTAVAGEMLFLANQGVDILRLDAVPFLWKEMGTVCENLPQAHLVVRALNALTDIAAPALVFKSEAIVHPDNVAAYVDPAECELSYNPLLMVCLWDAIATRDTRLLADCLETRHRTAAGTAWINYLRGHDDIGWGFANEDCARLGIDADAHRAFLNDFYTGRFDGSFARGLPFQENPLTGDCRISGTLASLAGLEAALEAADERLIDHAIDRIIAMHAVIMTVGGIPLIYLGDELAQRNDHSYLADPARARDNRWVHRPAYDWQALADARAEPSSPAGRVLAGLRRLIRLRQDEPALAGSEIVPLRLHASHLLAYRRPCDDRAVTLIVNLTERPTMIDAAALSQALGAERLYDHWSRTMIEPTAGLRMAPYAIAWLAPPASRP